MLTQCQVKRGESEEGPYFTVTFFNISFVPNSNKLTKTLNATDSFKNVLQKL